MANFLRIFEKKKTQGQQEGVIIKDALRNKYFTFQSLLAENNRVLTLMAEMEARLEGEHSFDREFLHGMTLSIIEGVHKLIEYVNLLSDNKYRHLYSIHAAIKAELQAILAERTIFPESELVLPFAALSKEMALIAGHKNVHLGEIEKGLALSTPEGFAISSTAFRRFMEHNRLTEKISRHLASIDVTNLDELVPLCEKIQVLVQAAEIPAELERAIARAVSGFCSQVQGLQGQGLDVASTVSVRSSAIHEDGQFTFAGQYATFLNVPLEKIPERYKAVVASLFTPKALYYSKTKGFSVEDLVMAVGVMRMIQARAGGVMYTRDPNARNREVIIINGVWGLGKQVVDGTGTPHSFEVPRDNDTPIDRRIPAQKVMLVCKAGGDIEEVEVPAAMQAGPCLTDELVRLLAGYGSAIEQYFGCPQDIEWACDVHDRIIILQSRPLQAFTFTQPFSSLPKRLDNAVILLDQGVVACKGIGHGRAFVLQDEAALKDFPMGAVLVARHTDTKYVTIMHKAAAILTDVGGVTGHMATLSREYSIPTILDIGNATKVIKNGQEVTVDAINGVVYAGRVDELLTIMPAASCSYSPFKETSLYKTLEKALSRIVPLHLVDPEHESFKQESCRTLHDITRLIHEKAMTEIIFMSGRTQEVKSFEDLMVAINFAETGEMRGLRTQTSDLNTGIPMEAHVLDISGGLRDERQKVAIEDITSIPFHSFVKGLKEMKWPEAKPPAVQGIRGMLAISAPKSGEAIEKVISKSYAIISLNYMNFSLKLGYHFSMVEAYASENRNDNYIKFFFKGGGASPDRKLRRVRLISEILRKMDLRVKVTEDVVNAMLTKYKLPAIEARLEVLGKLTVYTKQLDMAMFNDAITDMFIEDFIRDHMSRL